MPGDSLPEWLVRGKIAFENLENSLRQHFTDKYSDQPDYVYESLSSEPSSLSKSNSKAKSIGTRNVNYTVNESNQFQSSNEVVPISSNREDTLTKNLEHSDLVVLHPVVDSFTDDLKSRSDLNRFIYSIKNVFRMFNSFGVKFPMYKARNIEYSNSHVQISQDDLVRVLEFMSVPYNESIFSRILSILSPQSTRVTIDLTEFTSSLGILLSNQDSLDSKAYNDIRIFEGVSCAIKKFTTSLVNSVSNDPLNLIIELQLLSNVQLNNSRSIIGMGYVKSSEFHSWLRMKKNIKLEYYQADILSLIFESTTPHYLDMLIIFVYCFPTYSIEFTELSPESKSTTNKPLPSLSFVESHKNSITNYQEKIETLKLYLLSNYKEIPDIPVQSKNNSIIRPRHNSVPDVGFSTRQGIAERFESLCSKSYPRPINSHLKQDQPQTVKNTENSSIKKNIFLSPKNEASQFELVTDKADCVSDFKKFVKQLVLESSSLLDVFRNYDLDQKKAWARKDIIGLLRHMSPKESIKNLEPIADNLLRIICMDGIYQDSTTEIYFNELYVFVYDEKFLIEIQKPFQSMIACKYASEGDGYRAKLINIFYEFTCKKRSSLNGNADSRTDMLSMIPLQSNWINSTNIERLLSEILELSLVDKTVSKNDFIRRLKRRVDVDGDGWHSVSLLLRIIQESSEWRNIEKESLEKHSSNSLESENILIANTEAEASPTVHQNISPANDNPINEVQASLVSKEVSNSEHVSARDLFDKESSSSFSSSSPSSSSSSSSSESFLDIPTIDSENVEDRRNSSMRDLQEKLDNLRVNVHENEEPESASHSVAATPYQSNNPTRTPGSVCHTKEVSDDHVLASDIIPLPVIASSPKATLAMSPRLAKSATKYTMLRQESQSKLKTFERTPSILDDILKASDPMDDIIPDSDCDLNHHFNSTTISNANSMHPSTHTQESVIHRNLEKELALSSSYPAESNFNSYQNSLLNSPKKDNVDDVNGFQYQLDHQDSLFRPAPRLSDMKGFMTASSGFINDWMTMNSTPANDWYDESIRGIGRGLVEGIVSHIEVVDYDNQTKALSSNEILALEAMRSSSRNSLLDQASAQQREMFRLQNRELSIMISKQPALSENDQIQPDLPITSLYLQPQCPEIVTDISSPVNHFLYSQNSTKSRSISNMTSPKDDLEVGNFTHRTDNSFFTRRRTLSTSCIKGWQKLMETPFPNNDESLGGKEFGFENNVFTTMMEEIYKDQYFGPLSNSGKSNSSKYRESPRVGKIVHSLSKKSPGPLLSSKPELSQAIELTDLLENDKDIVSNFKRLEAIKETPDDLSKSMLNIDANMLDGYNKQASPRLTIKSNAPAVISDWITFQNSPKYIEEEQLLNEPLIPTFSGRKSPRRALAKQISGKPPSSWVSSPGESLFDPSSQFGSPIENKATSHPSTNRSSFDMTDDAIPAWMLEDNS